MEVLLIGKLQRLLSPMGSMAYSRSICTNLKAERSYMRLHWVDLSCCTYTFLPQSAIVLCLRYFGCAGIINVGYFTLQKQ